MKKSFPLCIDCKWFCSLHRDCLHHTSLDKSGFQLREYTHGTVDVYYEAAWKQRDYWPIFAKLFGKCGNQGQYFESRGEKE